MALLLLGAFLAWQSWYLVQVIYWIDHNPAVTAFMTRVPASQRRQAWVPYRRVSVHIRRAVVASEDARFMEHAGFDWQGIETAMKKNIRRGRLAAGGSTITQQLAKNLFLSPERSWWRKAQESLITLMLEAVMSKRRILEIYLNVVEWGDGIYGVQAAAHHYYGRDAADLQSWQAARLAVMLPNPRYFEKHQESAWLLDRASVIHARMIQVRVP